MDFLWFVLIGLAAGWLAGQIMGSGDHGLVGDIAVGVVGAVLGGVLFRVVGIPVVDGLFGSLVVATVAAITLISGLRVLKQL